MSDSSAKLCIRACGGDLAAASELVTLHYQQMFAYFRRQCSNDSDAADLTQKTFTKVWASLPTYGGLSSFSTWIHSIGHNVFVDWLRKTNRLDAQPDAWWENCVANGPSPYEDAAERDQAARLHTLVANLDDDKKEIVHLHYYQGLSIRDTADVLGVATSTVKYRLRAALDSLKSQTAANTAKSNL